jgi:hypothetical protein
MCGCGGPSSAPATRAPVVASTGVTGVWRIVDAKNQLGQPYTGTVTITQRGKVFTVSRDTSAGTYSGMGLEDEGHLYVGWDAHGSPGTLVQHVQPDGTLTGRWTATDMLGMGAETWTGQRGEIAGTYAVAGRNASAGDYTGTVDVSRVGDVYYLVWHIGSGELLGVGLRAGDRFCVGWGSGTVGVVDYAFTGDHAQGRWADFREHGVGVENLSR